MMKKLIYIFALAVLLFSCTKDENKFGNKEAEILVILSDITGQEQNTEGVVVKIKREGADEYLYQQSTNEDGIANFRLLKNTASYEVFASFEIDNITYIGSETFTVPEDQDLICDTLRMSFDPSTFNLLRVRFEDSQGGPLPTVDACLFLSSFLADSADCSASAYSQVSNSSGIVNFWDLDAGTYYMGIKDTVGGFPVSLDEEFQIQAIGTIDTTIVLF